MHRSLIDVSLNGAKLVLLLKALILHNSLPIFLASQFSLRLQRIGVVRQVVSHGVPLIVRRVPSNAEHVERLLVQGFEMHAGVVGVCNDAGVVDALPVVVVAVLGVP